MKTNIIKDENEEPVAVEVLESAILDIAKGMKLLTSSRLTKKAAIVLISYQSKIGMRDVEIVLNNLADFEKDWFKPVIK